MENIEAGISGFQKTRLDLEESLSILQKFGVRNLMFSEYFSLKAFNEKMGSLETSNVYLHVISHSNKGSIKMIWELLKCYDVFTLYLQCNESNGVNSLKDTFYEAYSLTDEVGLAVEVDASLTFRNEDLIQTLSGDFGLKSVLIQDSDGLLLPEDITRFIKGIRSILSKGTRILFFPNDTHGLGLINAFYTLRAGIDGIVGSVLREMVKDPQNIDLKRLCYLYQKKRNFFPKRLLKMLDRTFTSFV